MHVAVHDTADAFLARAAPLLEAHEARLSLIWSIAEGCRQRPVEGAWFATVEDGGVLGVALRTPPWPVQISELPREAIRLLVEALPETGGAVAPLDVVAAFAEAWCRARNVTSRDVRGLRLHALERVIGERTTQGAMRSATMHDLARIAAWTAAFQREVGELHRGGEERMARTWIESSGAFLWQIDDEPVSMAMINGGTPGTRRIGYVYTPPEHRRRGFAEALVAELSQHVLDAGVRQCLLYTDLANPTSNAIYRRIGYTPLVDVREVAFSS